MAQGPRDAVGIASRPIDDDDEGALRSVLRDASTAPPVSAGAYDAPNAAYNATFTAPRGYDANGDPDRPGWDRCYRR